MSNKQIVDQPRSSIFQYDPTELFIDGLDGETKSKEALFVPTAKDEPPPELVHSILTHGFISVIDCCLIDGKAVVVDGRTRVKAVRKINESLPQTEKIRVLVRFVKAKSDLALSSIKNLKNFVRRQETFWDTLQLVEHHLSVLGDVDYDTKQTQIAVSFGVPSKTARILISAVGGCEELKKAIKEGRIALHAAAEIVDLTHEEQRRVIGSVGTEKKITGSAIKEVVDPKSVSYLSKKLWRKAADVIEERGYELDQPGIHSLIRMFLGDEELDLYMSQIISELKTNAAE